MANTTTHNLTAQSGAKTVGLQLGNRRVAFRQEMMSAICGYRYPTFTPGSSYGIFSVIDPDVKENEQFFISFLGNFTKAAACFVKEYTETSTAISISGVYSNTTISLTDGGNSLSFPTATNTVIGDNGKHYIETAERKLGVFRTPWLIPTGTKAILFAFTAAAMQSGNPKLPLVNHGKTVIFQDSTPANIIATAASGATFKNLELKKSNCIEYDIGSVLNGSSSTISKWAFKY